MSSEVLVGKIVRTSGIKGYVKVHTFTQSAKDLNSFLKLFDDNETEYEIEKLISTRGQTITVKLRGINSINAAQNLVGINLFVHRSELEKLDDSSYYYSDLIGLDIYFEDNTKYGTVVNVVNYGASDIVEIKELETQKLVMYPFSDEFIEEINLSESKIVLKRLEII